VQPQNPFFVGREAELRYFARLLEDGDHLKVLNICGHSGVGKSWLLEEYRSLCHGVQIPFAHLSPRDVSGNPATLLTSFAQQIGLEGEWPDDIHTFDQLLPFFIPALHALDAPVAVLILDDYDRMLNFDPYMQLLTRHLTQPTPLMHNTKQLRVIVVIGSEIPLYTHWSLDPRLQPIIELVLHDFTLSETRAYFRRMNVSQRYERPLYQLTQGYPLALAMTVNLELWPDVADSLVTTEKQVILPLTDRQKLVQEILGRTWRAIDSETLHAKVVEPLRASALVRSFDQSLLAIMLDQPTLADAIFDRVTALSMVVEQSQVDKPRNFTLHSALRMALLEDAKSRGLEQTLVEYRCRALAFYFAETRRAKSRPEITFKELGLDILFLHSNPVIHQILFDSLHIPLPTGPASYDELDEILESLMQQNPLYHEIHLDGKHLERLVQETRDWLELDYELHGQTLHYFQVVRRSNATQSPDGIHDDNCSGRARGDLAGFALNVPVTKATLPLLRRDTIGWLYDTHARPISSHSDGQSVFLLRLVVGDWDCLSALIRAFFALLEGQVFHTLVTVTPWTLINMLMRTLGFDMLIDDIEYEGRAYTALRLDMTKYGGPIKWLYQLVRQDLGLPARRLVEDWEQFKMALQEALEELHGPFELLAQNPLIDELGLAGQDETDWERAQALIKTLQTVLDSVRLPSAQDRSDSAFQVLNKSYGIVGEAWKRFEYGGPRPSIEEIRKQLHCARGTYYVRVEESVEALARAVRRWQEKV
jgi:hypothetical protein